MIHAMKSPGYLNGFLWKCLYVASLSIFMFGGTKLYFHFENSDKKVSFSPTETETVRRVNLDTSVNAPGEVRSSNNTVVECNIERFYINAGGRGMYGGTSTKILEIIPDGSIVKKDDILCKLDSRDLEEAARLQKINLQQAQAMLKYTEMDLEVSKIAMEEYLNGTAKQRVQSLKQQMALAFSDAKRVTGRLDWSRKMYEKGYLSKATVRAEELSLQRYDMLLSQSQIALNTFEKFTKPRTEHNFKSRMLSQNYLRNYYQRWVQSQKDRLEKFEKQIELCTVRAPHDGIVIYANEEDGDTRIEVGSDVRQGQDLFYLPDLGNMEVLTKLSESIVEKVHEGMNAKVYIQSLSGKVFDARIVKVAQFPIPPSSWRSSPEVKNYYCIVKLEGNTSELRPGLTSEVEIFTDRGLNTLAISPEVVHLEDNREFCFVVDDQGRITKRQIRTRNGDPSYLSVIEGLEEGESVVRSPQKIVDQNLIVDEVVLLESPRKSNIQDAQLLSEFFDFDDAQHMHTTDSQVVKVQLNTVHNSN